MFLKLAVLNNSGNVGKSMICETLLNPRIPNCELIKIETINSDGTNDTKMSAKEIDEIFEMINEHDVCLLDVGASNIELFINNLMKIEGAIEDLDYIFIPTGRTAKQQQDTLTTIENLISLGVSESNIRIIFNYCDPDISLERQYKTIFSSPFLNLLDLSNAQNQFCIEDTRMFEFLEQTGLKYHEILNDTRDFRMLIRSTREKEERALLSLEQMTSRFAKGFDKKLDDVFNKLNLSCNLSPQINTIEKE